MRIAINGMFWDQPNVGSGQYLHGLLGALTRDAPEHEYILLLPARTENQEPLRPASGQARTENQLITSGSQLTLRVPVLGSMVVRTPFDAHNANLAKLWFEQIGVPRAAAHLCANVLHVPYFAPALLSPIPVVATVLDIIPLLLPEYRGGAAVRAYMQLVALAARRARHVIAISDDSRTDMIARLGCAQARVTTTPLAAGAQYRPLDRVRAAAEVAERYGLRGPFVYYVGGLDARKNVPALLCAWARLRHAGGPIAQLVIAGRALGSDTRLFPNLNRMIAELGIQDSVARIDVPLADNPLLYNAATAFAFPSRYEGFGLPPLEAMACGTPVVVSNASSLPEVVGDAALVVPPDDVSGWAAALWRLLADAALREELRARGFVRAAQFSYAHAAQATVEVYKRVGGSQQEAVSRKQ
jgi:glycosyltransferase involved in cell wall biosynthesis